MIVNETYSKALAGTGGWRDRWNHVHSAALSMFFEGIISILRTMSLFVRRLMCPKSELLLLQHLLTFSLRGPNSFQSYFRTTLTFSKKYVLW